LRFAALALLLIATARAVAGQDSAATRPVRITYLTTTSAYVDAGREDGLEEGDSLRVLRAGSAVGLLRVAFLASRQASCDILTDPAALVVGDTLDIARPAAPPAVAVAGQAAPETSARPSRRTAGLRGRVGARYLGVWRRDGVGGRLSQPSLDLRLDGQALGGTPVGIMLDLRTRRTSSIRPDGSSVVDGRTRAYQAALFFNPVGSPFRLTAGRQLSPSLASLTLLDGALAELRRPRWGLGLFAGSEPDPVSFDYSSDVRDYGGYLQLHSPSGSASQWSTALGAIGSYEAGLANREFAYLQTAVTSRRFSFYATQEVDYYRPWKQAMGEPSLSFSSSFASLRVELSRALSVNGGVDNRRNVRLYRDAVTPETAFDDAFRRGVWGGLSLRLGQRGRVGVDARSSSGGSLGRTLSYTLSTAADRLGPLELGVRSRTTRYDGPRQSGWLQSLTVGLSPAAALHVDLNGGLRIEQDPLADPVNVHVTWFGADVDLSLARGWYLLLSGTHEAGGFESNDQLYGGLSFRF
jgi:hypothetical protein